jgi:hypothetical protein
MRIVFESPRVPVVHNHGGRSMPGLASAIVIVYDQGEKVPASAHKVSEVLAKNRLNADGSLTDEAPREFVGAKAVLIPAVVLRALAPDTLIEYGWQVKYGAQR